MPADSALDAPFLFDPRAQVKFAGKKATFALWADGFKATYGTITRDYDDDQPQPLNLTHKFYWDGDPKTRSRQHVIKVELRDSTRRKTTYTCKFPLRF